MSVYIIAEAGVNHNGSLQEALRLVDAAVEAGADCIKFQTFKASAVVTKDAAKADYQKQQDGASSQYEMLKRLELSFDDFAKIKAYCEEKAIDFLSTAFDEESFAFLQSLNPKVWKVPSGEITNYPFLKAVAETKAPIILSTGMATGQEVGQALEVLKEGGPITILHCTTEYPAPLEEVNLRAMLSLAEDFGLPIGYSDHTAGITVSLAAVALGAQVIEKHFTLDKNQPGPDHAASLEPKELKALVQGSRAIELALGDGVKQPGRRELKNAAVARKSILARRDIKQGQVFSEDLLVVKRPGTGLSPMAWPKLLGKRASRDYKEEEFIDQGEI